MSKRVHGGRFYVHDNRTGELRDLSTTAARPDLWICRRVADFPDGYAPAGAAVAACARCAAAIAFDPSRAFADPVPPKVCMQCADIQPEPIDTRDR